MTTQACVFLWKIVCLQVEDVSIYQQTFFLCKQGGESLGGLWVTGP